jgi:hypothetical protein
MKTECSFIRYLQDNQLNPIVSLVCSETPQECHNLQSENKIMAPCAILEVNLAASFNTGVTFNESLLQNIPLWRRVHSTALAYSESVSFASTKTWQIRGWGREAFNYLAWPNQQTQFTEK